MRNESDVKNAVKKILNDLGAFWFMPVQTGYGVKGVPDFIVCLNGAFIGIETKYGNNTLSMWQKLQGEKILNSGGAFLVVNETNVSGLKDKLLAAASRCCN